jgi:hypothetical protein
MLVMASAVPRSVTRSNSNSAVCARSCRSTPRVCSSFARVGHHGDEVGQLIDGLEPFQAALHEREPRFDTRDGFEYFGKSADWRGVVHVARSQQRAFHWRSARAGDLGYRQSIVMRAFRSRGPACNMGMFQAFQRMLQARALRAVAALSRTALTS